MAPAPLDEMLAGAMISGRRVATAVRDSRETTRPPADDVGKVGDEG
jgi:hypothetical protein